VNGATAFFLDDLTVASSALLGVPAPSRSAAALVVAPNPARGAATAVFALTQAGAARVTVHDLGGRLVRTLVDGPLPEGRHRARWDGRDASGVAVAPGAYFVRVAVPRLAPVSTRFALLR